MIFPYIFKIYSYICDKITIHCDFIANYELSRNRPDYQRPQEVIKYHTAHIGILVRSRVEYIGVY